MTRQIVLSNDFKMRGTVVGNPHRCICGNWKYPVRWDNGKLERICVSRLLELTWGSWHIQKYRVSTPNGYKEVIEKPSADKYWWNPFTNTWFMRTKEGQAQ